MRATKTIYDDGIFIGKMDQDCNLIVYRSIRQPTPDVPQGLVYVGEKHVSQDFRESRFPGVSSDTIARIKDAYFGAGMRALLGGAAC